MITVSVICTFLLKLEWLSNVSASRPLNLRVCIPDDAYVIPSECLAGDRDARSPRFLDNTWDLTQGIHQPGTDRSRTILRFDDSDSATSILKPYAWCCLNVETRGEFRLERVQPFRLVSELGVLRLYLKFLSDRETNFFEVTTDDLEAWVSASTLEYSNSLRRMSPPRRLYLYQQHLGVQPKKPWPGLSPKEVIGKRRRRRENATPRVPEHIFGPYVRWALHFCEHYPEVLDYIRFKSGLTTEPPSFSCFSETSVVWRSVTDELGWHQQAAFLTIAAFVVTMTLSCGRSVEIKGVTGKSKVVELDASGRVALHCLMVTMFKGKKSIFGKQHRYVVLPETHRALESMEALGKLVSQIERRRKGQVRLFRSFGAKYVNEPYELQDGEVRQLMRQFDRHIQALAQEALERCTEADRAVMRRNNLVPDTSNFPWQVKHFRRTPAWFIANRPFGIVAGMRQYGQAAEAIFQGYAGTPKSGFPQEVARARADEIERDIVALYEQVRSGKHLGGKKGAELEGQFDQIASQIHDLPGRVVDDRQLLKMLKSLGRLIYPGIINDCHFDVTTALCLPKEANKQNAQPRLALCDPERCKNGCWDQKHLPMIDEAREDAVRMRRTRGLSRNQRSALDKGIAKYDRMKAAIS